MPDGSCFPQLRDSKTTNAQMTSSVNNNYCDLYMHQLAKFIAHYHSNCQHIGAICGMQTGEIT